MIQVPISTGELIDKLTILKIKSEKITDVEKLVNIEKEYNLLLEIMTNTLKIREDNEDFCKLYELNLMFWEYHDWQRKRWKEIPEGLIDPELYNRTRTEHEMNDERARIKREINNKYQSSIIEEKAFL